MRILIAEDNEADLFLLREALDAAGLKFQAQIASNGERVLAAVDQMAEEAAPKVDAMILDLNLTTHGGIEILKHVRAIPQLAQIPIVVLTSSASPVDRERAERLGANAFFQKSMDLDTFMQLGQQIATLLKCNVSSSST